MQHSSMASAKFEESLKALIGEKHFWEALPVGIYCCDREGLIWYFNRRAAELWGRAPEIGSESSKFCGAKKLYHLDGSDLPHVVTPMAEVLQTGASVRDRKVLVERPDGTRRYVLVNIDPLFDEEGVHIGAVNCFQDITELCIAEGRSQESERHLRAVLESLPGAVYTTDADGKITFFNEAAVEMAGRRPQLGVDEWCVTWRLFHTDGTPMPHDKCPMARALKERRPVRGEEALAERPDGTRVRFEAFPTPLFDENGVLTGAVNMLLDVTDKHRAEIESAYLAAIVTSSNDAIVSKSLEGIIRSWNEGARRMFGYDASEMIGQPITRIIPPELHGQEREILAKLKRGERIGSFETVRLTKDGRRLDISLTVSPMHDRFGRVVGASKVARDITERKRAEETQRLLIGELNHRVKNTLATVQSMANQTLGRANCPEEFASAFNGRIQALANAHDLLTRNSWRGTDFHTLVRTQLVLTEAEMNQVTLDGPTVILDAQPTLHLALVMHELGTNARKYGALSVPNGQLAIAWKIKPGTGEQKRELLVQWKESGGPKVNKPSERGFGSLLIETSLTTHAGDTRIDYRPEGIICTLRLPLGERKHEYLPESASTKPRDAVDVQPSGEPQSQMLRGTRILVIEDEPLIAMDIAQTLSSAGCIVVGPAPSVAKAAEYIAAGGFDTALLDANLDGEPVDSLAEALTNSGRPFAFLTGYGREGLPQAFQDAPMISKPFTREDAFETVGLLIREAAAKKSAI